MNDEKSLKNLTASPVGEFHWYREGEIIRCPGPGWEFDIKTGRSIFSPHKVRTKSYPVILEKISVVKEESVEAFPVSVEEDVVFVQM